MFRAVMKAVLASPPTVRTVVISAAILMCWFGVNWAYHACLAAGGLCNHPEWLAAGAALAGALYLMRNRISA